MFELVVLVPVQVIKVKMMTLSFHLGGECVRWPERCDIIWTHVSGCNGLLIPLLLPPPTTYGSFCALSRCSLSSVKLEEGT